MRLAEFIARDKEAIIARWEDFAATRLPAAASMGSLELRDHAREILEAIVTDLGTPQSRDEQDAKSKGLAPVQIAACATAAQVHAVLRARSGFDIRQLASEYRALRTSVLVLWMEAIAPSPPDHDDIIRFNEAIDQALAESIDCFSAQVEQSRNLLLGMLSHDMRTPLQAIQMTAVYLGRLNAGEDVWKAAQRLIDSGKRVHALLDDLMDFNRANLRLGIPVVRAEVDLGRVFADEIAELRAAHPDRDIELSITGDCRGQWDGRRLQQLIGNLVANALLYGNPETPVRIAVTGEDGQVRLDVTNSGAAIDQATINQIFEPLKRGPRHPGVGIGLGLGLYIVREIAKAHGGNIEVRSSGGETTFSVRLPRQAA